jgi:hypothetical protein
MSDLYIGTEPLIVFDDQDPMRLSDLPENHPLVLAIRTIAASVLPGDVGTVIEDAAEMALQTLEIAAQQASIAVSLNAASANTLAAAETAVTDAATTLAAATTAQSSATASATSAAGALSTMQAALAAFKAVFVGEFAADPTVDGNGNPLMAGAEYFNTVTKKLRVYSGTAWGDYDATAQEATNSAVLSAANAAASAAAAAASTAAIGTGSSPDAGVITGAEIFPVSRGAGLLQTTITKIATFALTLCSILWVSGAGAVARTLKAVILDQPLSVKMFGAKGDRATDDTSAILAAMTLAVTLNMKLAFPAGTYIVSDLFLSMPANSALDMVAVGKVILQSNKTSPRITGGSLDSAYPGLGIPYDSDYFIRVQPTIVGTDTLTANAERGNTWLSVANVGLYTVGSLLKINSTRLIQTDHRGSAIEGQITIVDQVDAANNRIRIRDPLEYTAPANTVTTGTVASVVASDHLTLSGVSLPDAQARVKCTFTTRGGFSYISRFNSTTGDAYYRGLFRYPIPSGVAAGDPVSLSWSTAITVYTPFGISMSKGFTLTRAPHTGATAGDIGFRGLDVQYASRCEILNLKSENFSEACARVSNCYRPEVSNPYFYGANRAYTSAQSPNADGTGYGLSVMQCYAPVVSNLSAANCRRGLDFGGYDAIVWHAIDETPHVTGGGETYTGTEFFPAGPIAQSGVGGHGPSYYCRHISPAIVHCRNGIVIRGYRETIQDAHWSGYTYAPVYIEAGGTELRIKGGRYEDGITDLAWGAQYQTSSMPQNLARMLVYLAMTSDSPNVGLSLDGIRAETVSQALVGVDTTGSLETFQGMLTLEMGNCLTYASATGSNPAVTNFQEIAVYPSLATVELKYNDLGGNRINQDGSYTGGVTKLALGLVWNQTPGDVIQLSDSRFVACVSNQSVIKIPVSGNAKQCQITIWDREQGRAYRGQNMILGAGLTTDISPITTNKTGIAIYNTPLAGTTGSANSMNIAFRPTGGSGFLYIENQLGGEMRPVIDLMMIE